MNEARWLHRSLVVVWLATALANVRELRGQSTALLAAVATLIDPSPWLHPIGPLTKNAPIAAVLLFLAGR